MCSLSSDFGSLWEPRQSVCFNERVFLPLGSHYDQAGGGFRLLHSVLKEIEQLRGMHPHIIGVAVDVPAKDRSDYAIQLLDWCFHGSRWKNPGPPRGPGPSRKVGLVLRLRAIVDHSAGAGVVVDEVLIENQAHPGGGCGRTVRSEELEEPVAVVVLEELNVAVR